MSMMQNSAVPENIHTCPKESHWKFLGGGVWVLKKVKILEATYEAKLEFSGRWGVVELHII